MKKAIAICLLIITLLTTTSCDIAEEIINETKEDVNNISSSSEYALFFADLTLKAAEKQVIYDSILSLITFNDYEKSLDFIFKINGDGTCSVLGAVNPLAEELTIPEKSPSGRTVTAIADCAFYMKSNLVKITMPNTVSKIGYGAFSDCKKLKSVNLSENTTEIGDGAFVNCFSLEELEIPESVTRIGKWAFASCAIKSLSIPDGVTDIGTGAFFSCDNLETVDLPSGITKIEYELFLRCPSLTSIDIPKGVQSIDSRAFMGCLSLKYVEIPDGVTTIGSCAFMECSEIEKIELPEGITTIPTGLFFLCNASLVIPKSVKVIEPKAFEYYGGSPSSISYAGTWAEWCEIDIREENGWLNDKDSYELIFLIQKLYKLL